MTKLGCQLIDTPPKNNLISITALNGFMGFCKDRTVLETHTVTTEAAGTTLTGTAETAFAALHTLLHHLTLAHLLLLLQLLPLLIYVTSGKLCNLPAFTRLQ